MVGGPTITSYAVQDKAQEAELDPAIIVDDDELFAVEAWEPCLVCGLADDVHEVMYCDGCDKAVHVFCAGYDESPEVWYCDRCLVDLENDIGLPGITSAMRRQPRRRMPARRTNDRLWARVWREVSRRLDLDLDFPFDDEPTEQRTEEQRREFTRWQRRLEEASRQGAAANRLRGIANARIQQAAAPEPESQEELKAWNAFDKARESQDAPSSIRRSKRKRTPAASPAPSSIEPELVEEPQQKRPRLRRPPVAIEQQQAAESSNAAGQGRADEPTFLSSLLREVQSKPISASSPGASDYQNGQFSPRDSSPGASPSSSGPGTPRGGSVTPPPVRLVSPPLSSTIVPLSSPGPALFSPFSPTAYSRTHDRANNEYDNRGRRRGSHDSGSDDAVDRASSASPSRPALSYSTKEEIQRMVKLALGSRYREKEITKEQYTDINRDVSRKMYELVGDASHLADSIERDKWQKIAEEEVQKAVAALATATIPDT